MMENLPDPDDFGMLPQRQEPAQENAEPTKEEVAPTPEYPRLAMDDEVREALSHLERKILNHRSHSLWPRPILDDPLLEERYRGSYYNLERTEYTPPPPIEKPDPYPSRAGWRADYAPPHNPLEPDKSVAIEVPIRIGNYPVIKSDTRFSDIGGNAKGKETLLEISYQFEDPDLYTAWDVPVPKGVLLYGKPGTGKTMLAKAFANEAKADFVEVPVASLRDKYYGQDQKNLKALFDAAGQHYKQVVIFFDEINNLLPNRAGMSSDNPNSQLVDTFLQCMDGMQSAKNVMVLGATNFRGRLDPAATRPGRFDQEVEVLLPDDAGRQEIVARRLLSAERNAKRVLVEDTLDLPAISNMMEGYSGAEIAEVLNRVKRTMAQTQRALRKNLSIQGLYSEIDFGGEHIAGLRIGTQDILNQTAKYNAGRPRQRRQ